MKHLNSTKTLLLLFLLTTFWAGTASAQCVVNPPSSSPGVYPNPLPTACVGQSYVTEIQFVFPLDTTVTVPPFGTFTIPFDSFRVDAIINTPSGLNLVQSSPNSTYYPVGGVSARGCGDVTGIPIVANTPLDSISIAITAWATAPIVGVQAGQDTLRISLRVFDTPAATFTASGTGNSRSFTATGAGATSWAWDFGDGGTSTLQNPTHVYSGSGVYNACLITSNGNCADTSCQPITIGCPPPTVAFNSISNGLSVDFTDNTSGSPVAWLWDFGDGNIATTQSPTHTYAAAGTYTVCLTVQDTCGTDSSCASVTVCPRPTAGFNSSSTGLDVSFTDNSSGTPLTWFWDFGDGANATTQNPTHTYATGGSYTACLIIMDACGSDTICNTILVCEPLNAQFSFTNSGNGLTYQFTNTSTGNGTTYAWDFGDGNTSTSANPSHTYAGTTSATVCLIIIDSCAAVDTFCQSITITALQGAWNDFPISLFPNPTSGQLQIQAGIHSGAVSIRISDLTGKEVKPGQTFTGINGSFDASLDVSTLPAGLYFLTLENRDQRKTVRFIKE